MRYLVLLVLALLAVSFAQDGETAYNTNCVACHQATGMGLPGAFPPLAANLPEIMAAEGGRDYLLKNIIFGQMGEIVIGENTYNGAMPGWATLSNEDIAAVLNYTMISWDNDKLLAELLAEEFVPYTAEEVETARAEELSFDDIAALRAALVFGE